MSELRIGSLCSGYEGLGLAVTEVLGGELTWVADNDAGASKILAHRFPSVPNLGDIGKVNWAEVGPVDIALTGFPCTNVSCAGGRAGLREGNQSGVWNYCADAIGVLRPSLVIIENVRGLHSAPADSNLEPCPWCVGDGGDERPLRASGAVLGDLADLGYDARWVTVSASDVGAPHRRERVFILAADTEREPVRVCAGGLSAAPGAAERPPAQRERFRVDDGDGGGAAEDADRAAGGERGVSASGQAPGRWPRADASRPGGAHADWPDFQSRAASDPGSAGLEVGPVPDHGPERQAAERGSGDAPAHPGREHGDRWPEGAHAGQEAAIGHQEVDSAVRRGASPAVPIAWGAYEPAIRRWEAVLGRPAPRPTEPGRTGERLSPRFVEFMMGLPEGWVTDVPGLSRNQQLHALGNGVVPAQAAMALRILLAEILEAAA